MPTHDSIDLRSGRLWLALVAAALLSFPSLLVFAFPAGPRSAEAFPPPLPLPLPAAPAVPPTGVAVTLFNVNNLETLEIAIPFDGVLDPMRADVLSHFLRCKRTDRERPIDSGELAILADLADEYPGRVIEIISGYRAPPYGKPHSKHFTGHAIDLRVRGVATAEVRDYLWRRNGEVGVGHYTHEDFVHVDHRPGEGDMAWTVGASGRYRYHPAWSERARAIGMLAPAPSGR